jgi:hypothetical protein
MSGHHAAIIATGAILTPQKTMGLKIAMPRARFFGEPSEPIVFAKPKRRGSSDWKILAPGRDLLA